MQDRSKPQAVIIPYKIFLEMQAEIGSLDDISIKDLTVGLKIK